MRASEKLTASTILLFREGREDGTTPRIRQEEASLLPYLARKKWHQSYLTGETGRQFLAPAQVEAIEREDKNGGGKRSKHKVVVESIEFLGSRNPDGPPPAPANRSNSRVTASAPHDEELPDSYTPDTPSTGQEDEDPIPF